MKRIRVPDELLSAVESEVNAIYCPTGATSVAVEAVLRYLSEHPQVPTDEQLEEIDEMMYPSLDAHKEGIWDGRRELIREWQRRCFVQEEPEIPEEIKDLLFGDGSFPRDKGGIDACIIEAYRRGLRKGEQK